MGSYAPVPPSGEQPSLRADSDSAPEFLPPQAGFNPPPLRPVRRQRPSWAYSPATYSLVGINCMVFLAMVAHHVSAIGAQPRSIDVLGRRQCRQRADLRAVVAHCHRHVCPCGHSAPGHQHVVPVESGIAGRAADGLAGLACGLHPHRRGGQPAVHLRQLVEVLPGLGDYP